MRHQHNRGFTLGDWLVPALTGRMAAKSIWRKIQDHAIYRAIIHFLKKLPLSNIFCRILPFFERMVFFQGVRGGGAMGGHFGPEHAPDPSVMMTKKL